MSVGLLRFAALVSFILALTVAPTAWAKPPAKPGAVGTAGTASTAAPTAALPSDGETPPKPEFDWQMGPKPVELGHELHFDVPDGYSFLGQPGAAKLLEKNGTFHNEDLVGVVTKEADEGEWFAVMRYEEAGYVKDDEKIDAEELLKSFREGQEQANKERVQRGFPALTIGGWSEPPRYAKAAHQLVWALTVSSNDHTSVNYNTRVLGRRGYVSINLVTGADKLSKYRDNATTLLGATRFNGGARYEDFNEKTDKVAEYGLVGLILGGAGLGAAKLVKVGLLAKFGKGILALLVAGKKAVVVALAAVGAFFKKLFNRQPKPAATPTDTTDAR